MKYLFSIIIMFLSFISFSQELRTNDKGEKIIVYPDGSWKYYEQTNENSDSTKKSDPKKTTTTSKKDESSNKNNKTVRTPPKTTNTNPPSNTKQPLSKLELRALDEKSKKIANPYAEMVIQAERKAFDSFKNASLAKLKAQEVVNSAYKSNSLVEIQKLEQLENELDARVKEEKTTKELYQKYASVGKQAKALLKITDYKKRDAELVKLQKNYKKLTNDNSNDNEVAASGNDIKSTTSKASANEMKFFSEINILTNPPKNLCEFKFKGVDDFTGKVKFETTSDTWFAHTEEKLKSFMGAKDFLKADASLVGLSGGIFYLNVTIEIASKTAPLEFGVLDKGSALSLFLINGEVIKLVNRNSDPGKVNAMDGNTIYEGNYQMDINQLKSIAKSEVDQVKLVWSSGFEEYDVFNVDLLMNYANCMLENSK